MSNYLKRSDYKNKDKNYIKSKVKILKIIILEMIYYN